MLILFMALMALPVDQFDHLELKKEVVQVSWYGDDFAGKQMASGEDFDPACPRTVAHKSLPFGTWILFRNPKNGRVLLARVEDRGPYNYRKYDLSEAGAEALGFKDEGVAKLEVVVLTPP